MKFMFDVKLGQVTRALAKQPDVVAAIDAITGIEVEADTLQDAENYLRTLSAATRAVKATFE